MMDRVITPAAPTPVMARPKRKMGREVARDVMKEPMANMMEEIRVHERGEKM